MTRTRQALWVLVAAMALGLLGDGLLRAWPWGLNIYICTGAFIALLMALAGWTALPLPREARWLLLPVTCFAAGFVWRDSRTLYLLDFLGLGSALGVLGVGIARAHAGGIRAAAVTEFVRGATRTYVDAVTGALPLAFSEVRWRELSREHRWARFGAVGTGLFIAVPLLLVFGTLLMSADAVFANVVTNAVDWNVSAVMSHVFWIGAWGYVTAGLLRGMLWPRTPRPGRSGAGWSLGLLEVSVPLGLVSLLFLLFVVVQIRYLFGGTEVVETVAGLSYAEYARHGFFELVGVTSLVLPLLLGADWLVRSETPDHRRSFRALAIVLLLLLGVMAASALFRMRLYVAEYGLTELRLYTTVFMFWLVGMLVWFGLTVLRERRDRFAFGSLVSGWGTIAALHVVNPDALIVRTNLARLEATSQFDARYAASLSADAAPTLIAALPLLEQHGVCLPAFSRYDERRETRASDWRSWNWDRAWARALIRERREALKAAHCERTGG